jgi:SAM-dependent methyltransferase
MQSSLKKLARTVIGYYRANFGREEHRLAAMVGAMHVWNESRDFQIEFLRQRGLKESDTVLDIGCGPLRGGVPLIEFVNPGGYTGFDVRNACIEKAHGQIEKLDLTVKKPRVFLSNDFGATELIGLKFDYVWCFQILYHLDDPLAEECFRQIANFLGSSSTCYANVNVFAESGRWKEFPFLKRSLEFYKVLGEKVGLHVRSIGQLKDFGFTDMIEGQFNHMLEIRKAS